MKKLYAVADAVPEWIKNITAGKEYEIASLDSSDDLHGRGFEITDDNGLNIYCFERHCAFIDYGNWRIIEREENQTGLSITAHEILTRAAGHLEDRARTYDKPEGERSMGAAVAAFSAISGVTMTEEQGWLFMALLKAVRTQQGNYRADNYEDGAAYFALAGESAAKERA